MEQGEGLGGTASDLCRMEEALLPVDPRSCFSRPIDCSELSCYSKLHLGSLLECLDSLCVTGRRRMGNGLFKTDMFVSVLEGTDCEFCLQHPIFGFLFL